MVSSVEEKMMMSEPAQMKKNNENRMNKKMGFYNGEIKRLGISNQKLTKRMGV